MSFDIVLNFFLSYLSYHIPVLILALLLDHLFGEVRRYHPLVGFGRYARALEKRLWADQFSRGFLAVSCVCLPMLAIAFALEWLLPAFWLLDALLLYFVIGGRSLTEHGQAVADALTKPDLSHARHAVSMIVSRETKQMDRQQIISATMESMLENGNDAVFGALFWYLIAGIPGMILYRMSNTLDAMWGYKNERFLKFGYAAAKLDDALNYLPARCCAFTYAVLGKTNAALMCWSTQAKACSSPNGGPVMTAGAGALEVLIGGDAVYHGQLIRKPLMGTGVLATAKDITRAVQLVRYGAWSWVGIMSLLWAIGFILHAFPFNY